MFLIVDGFFWTREIPREAKLKQKIKIKMWLKWSAEKNIGEGKWPGYQNMGNGADKKRYGRGAGPKMIG